MISFLVDSQLEPALVVRHARAARRLRVEVPSLQGDRWLGRRLERTAHTWPGVVDVAADSRSGRMLLEYAPGAPLLEQLEEIPDIVAPPLLRGFGRRRSQEREPWHGRTLEEVFERLETGPEGLAHREASRRLRIWGANAAEVAEERSRIRILGGQLANVPMAMLLGSAGISGLLGDATDAAAMLVVVGLNAGIGYRIERRNQDVIASWRKLEAGLSQVIRGGELRTIGATELVPGDLLIVRAGDILPADARVIDAHRLACDEAPLTGESEPQPKHADPVEPDAPLAERASMLYAGTSIVSGHGRAVVVATGAGTELARIRELVERAGAPQAPLARRMESLGRRVAGMSVGAAGLAAGASLLHGRPVAEVLRGSVALGVAALPEGMPLVATSALVRSMQRLHQHGMVVRKVAAAEALGGVTVICADKTGTLTVNEMRLELLDLGSGPVDPSRVRARREALFEDPATTALASALLNSDVDVLGGKGDEMAMSGSATERALVDAAHAAGLDGAALRRTFPRRSLHERRKGVHYVVSVHDGPGGAVSFVKGAPEQVAFLCDKDVRGPLDDEGRKAILRRNEELADGGLRVLALAFRRGTGSGGYTYLGLAGLRDPLREGAASAVRRARRAGIRTLILTGDQRRTAEAIARQVGLKGDTLEAEEVSRLAPDALRQRLSSVAVLARVTPEEKVRIVRALRDSGEIVAMAGDGINDAPALKAADVGIAVGARASDLARQVADVVMAGEDLRSILAAVGEGRIVQDNLRRALRFLFATNLSEVALVLGAALVGARAPLGPMQLLWINLLTDTLPALALALEPGDPEVLDRRPARPEAGLLEEEDVRKVIRDGLLLAGIGAAGLAVGGPPVAFATLTAAQLSYGGVCRAPRWKLAPDRQAAGLRFAGLVGGAGALQLGALVLPPLRTLLGMPAPGPLILGGFAAGAVLPWVVRGLPAPEVIVRRGEKSFASEVVA